MKIRNKFYKVIVMLLMLTLLVPSVLPMNEVASVQAAEKIKLSEKSLILNPGDTDILQVKGTKKKATWSSSDSTIATVSNKGIVVAINAGKAIITAQVSNKRLTCTVVVMPPANPYLGTASFAAKEIDLGNMNAIIPKDWTCNIDASDKDSINYEIYPSSTDTKQVDYTCISIQISNTGEKAPAYDTVKEKLSQQYTIKNMEDVFKSDKCKVTISDFISSDFITTMGTAYKVKFNVNYNYDTGTETDKVVFYNLYLDQYYINLAIVDTGDNVTPDINQVAEYILNSLQIKK